jgi:hypothetical protein
MRQSHGIYVGIDMGSVDPSDKIRFCSTLHSARHGWRVQGTNRSRQRTLAAIYTISNDPSLAWNEVTVT